MLHDLLRAHRECKDRFAVVISSDVFFCTQYSDLEKEKTMIELEVKELIARHKSDMSEKGAQITQLEELNHQLTGNLDQKINDKDELNTKIKALQEGGTFAIRFDLLYPRLPLRRLVLLWRYSCCAVFLN